MLDGRTNEHEYIRCQQLLEKWPTELRIDPRFENIETLDLSWNKITTIPPESFFKLRQLTTVDLSFNELLAIPQDLSVLDRVRVLDLASNFIDFLPPEFDQLNLEEFYMAHNKLVQFPHELRDMMSLKILDLAGNEIRRVGNTLG